ncbi:DUF6934 family protein [Ohtaekwangia sp.]|uniref:DUF6934 family protein n=1 Tax=Ohtaekwangia sp. TaxID=2066019 RepID=UPI002F928FB2
MRYDRYTVEALPSLAEFEFYSEGPKGKIRKRVVFKRFKNNAEVYNLAFGDVQAKDEINDTIVTNNGDSRKVLATVGLAVLIFSENYPESSIFATGGTAARTRFYQMGISNNLHEIECDFYVFGMIDDAWEIFRKGVIYQAFLIRRNCNFDI